MYPGYGFGAPMYGTGMGMGMGMGTGFTEVRTETIRQTPFGTVDTITDQVYPAGGYGMGVGMGMGSVGGVGMVGSPYGMGMGYGGGTTVTETIRQTPFGTIDTITTSPNYGVGGFGPYGGRGFYWSSSR